MKKNVKLMVALLIVSLLSGVIAFGALSSEDTEGRAIKKLSPKIMKERVMKTKNSIKAPKVFTRAPKASPLDANPTPDLPATPKFTTPKHTTPVPRNVVPTDRVKENPFGKVIDKGASKGSSSTSGNGMQSAGSAAGMSPDLTIQRYTNIITENPGEVHDVALGYSCQTSDTYALGQWIIDADLLPFAFKGLEFDISNRRYLSSTFDVKVGTTPGADDVFLAPIYTYNYDNNTDPIGISRYSATTGQDMGGSLFEVSPSQALYLTLEGHYRYNTGSSVANGTQVRTVALTGLNGDHLGHFVGANGSQVNADLGVNSTIDIDSFEIGFIGGVGSDECNL